MSFDPEEKTDEQHWEEASEEDWEDFWFNADLGLCYPKEWQDDDDLILE
tara:strand:- start:22864 stop:23010 length:147 start_codon:yes stop_codon:yes gene_type:complete